MTPAANSDQANATDARAVAEGVPVLIDSEGLRRLVLAVLERDDSDDRKRLLQLVRNIEADDQATIILPYTRADLIGRVRAAVARARARHGLHADAMGTAGEALIAELTAAG